MRELYGNLVAAREAAFRVSAEHSRFGLGQLTRLVSGYPGPQPS
mgnify:CR=1 FL=1